MPIELRLINKILYQFTYKIRPRYWHYTATQKTLSLVPYYYLTSAVLPAAD
jgi:hypothetical protein